MNVTSECWGETFHIYAVSELEANVSESTLKVETGQPSETFVRESCDKTSLGKNGYLRLLRKETIWWDNKFVVLKGSTNKLPNPCKMGNKSKQERGYILRLVQAVGLVVQLVDVPT